MNIDVVIARRVRELRKGRGYALDTLAELSGVSRSMISLIERSETSPTAAVRGRSTEKVRLSGRSSRRIARASSSSSGHVIARA